MKSRFPPENIRMQMNLITVNSTRAIEKASNFDVNDVFQNLGTVEQEK